MDKQELLKSLESKGFSEKIIKAFDSVAREDFIPEDVSEMAYEDTALPLGSGQTISQPYTIAVMLSELRLEKGQKVLEVGSGSGYVLALISEIVGKKGEVFGLEVVKELAANSRKSLKDYKNVEVYHKNGSGGLSEKAPFDRVLVSAACRKIPESLLSQLKDGGILVAPKGPGFEQDIVVLQKRKQNFVILKKIPGFVFVGFVD